MNEYSEKIRSTMVAKMTATGGVSASTLSEKVGIPHQTLSRWRNEYATLGAKSGGVMGAADHHGAGWAEIEQEGSSGQKDQSLRAGA